MLNQSGIYEILNTVNGKRYIGSAKKFKARFNTHRSQLVRGIHHSIALQRAWNKYGDICFRFNVLLVCAKDRDILQMYEQQCFDASKPEYNIAPIAGSTLGFKMPPDVIAHLAEIRRGTKRSPESCAKQSATLTGRTLPDEWRENIAKGKIGKKHSPERCEANRQGQLGTKRTAEHAANISRGNKGKKKAPRTPEHTANHAASLRRGAALRRATKPAGQRGKPKSTEHKEKISKSLRGRKNGPRSKETCDKIRKALTGRVVPLDKRLKMSIARSTWWAAKRATKEDSIGY